MPASPSPPRPGPRTPPYDVIVAGAGPAGASAAISLARTGLSVLVLERARFPRHRVGESLTPKVFPLLRILGVTDEVQACGFATMTGTTVYDGNRVATHGFGADRIQGCSVGHSQTPLQVGLQVERAVFDLTLLDAARAAGCDVVESATITDILSDGGRVRGVRYRDRDSQDALQDIEARFTIDATGPAAAVARALGLRRQDSVRTIAICGYWRDCQAPADFSPNNTVFEMMPDGWIWSVLRSDGLRNVTFALDAATFEGGRSGLQERYAAALAASRLVGPLLEGAQQADELGTHDVTWSCADAYAGDGFLLVGDAASVIDPLTSQGVYKGLQSGIVGAAVVNTVLRRPDDAEMALAHHQRSQHRFRTNYADIALTMYRASAFADEPFWRERIRAGRPVGEAVGDEDTQRRSERRQAFVDAVQNQGGERVRVRVADGVRIEQSPDAVGGFIERRPCFVAPGAEPLRLLGVEADLLLGLLDGRCLAAVFEGYAAGSGTPRSNALGRTLMGATSKLAERGFLDLLPRDAGS